MKKLLFILITSFIALQIFAAVESNSDSSTGVDRYAIYIGSNNGGMEREQLLYAGSDAMNFYQIMSEIGGVQDSNSFVLIDPSKEKIDDTLLKISSKINKNKSNAKRSEFIFYYSGHSDETSLLLGDVPYDYSSLKHAISEIPSDIHIVILDSCYSGNFIRTKGGQKKKPFLMDDSSVVKGHAYLSSSSAKEFSQESDEIESSYFTNAMITGLRGAADTSGDNKVTLNELYSYAFNDTLSKTESSRAGPQHPNFNITLVGSGDLILSDISSADAMLSLSKEAKGTFIIRDANGKLISEINKTAGQPILMALPVGIYSATCIDEFATRQGTFRLEKNTIYELDQNNLSSIETKSTRVRGDDPFAQPEVALQSSESEPTEETEKFIIGDPIHISVLPGVALLKFTRDCSLVSLGMIGSTERNMLGVQASGIMNINTGKLIGAQTAGVFNIITNDVLGFQIGGVFNISQRLDGGQVGGLFNIAKTGFGAQVGGLFNVNKNFIGAQVAGFLNVSSSMMTGFQIAGFMNVTSEMSGFQIAGFLNRAKTIKGLQLGVVNIAKENNGVAIGVFNFIGNGMHHTGLTWNITDKMTDLFYQSGTHYLFTTVGISMPSAFKDSWNADCVAYLGIGSEVRLRHSSLDLEILCKSVTNFKNFLTYSTEVEITDDEFNYSVDLTDESKNYFKQTAIPSLRVTWNWIWGNHFEVSLGANTDLHIIGVNDTAFDVTTHNKKVEWLENDKWEIYYSYFVGVKFK